MGVQVLWLLCIPILIALLPLWMVLRSKEKNKLKKLLAVTLFLTFDLIIFGAFTRLTDSGLGCPDWPGCYDKAHPTLASADIAQAQQLMPTGPVTFAKAWIEMIHRYLAMTVGFLILVQVAMTWMKRKHDTRSFHYAMALLVFVLVQGAFGAWTVTLKLQPIIVTLHLLLGLGLLALLAWAWSVQEHPYSARQSQHRGLIISVSLATFLLVMQIALGGWVSTNYAALACHGFPSCNGAMVPELDFEHGFTLWRELGKTAGGDYLNVAALVSIHWVHRSFAWIALIAVVSAAWMARQHAPTQKLANALLALICVQFMTGVATVYFAWPLTLAVLHNAGAASLVLLMTLLNYRVRYTLSN
jgi:cytochrome c oxidase assembly protein subunit 15